jgi:hypothetical protein
MEDYIIKEHGPHVTDSKAKDFSSATMNCSQSAGMKQKYASVDITASGYGRDAEEGCIQQGDLVYLFTQNITFQKGLAQKLIPKYMGPYKILQDYGNSLFKIDLPAELKKDGFIAFWQETQLGNGPEVKEEWAVEEILSYHRMQGDTIFEIK